jgi:hypothetical protein
LYGQEEADILGDFVLLGTMMMSMSDLVSTNFCMVLLKVSGKANIVNGALARPLTLLTSLSRRCL